MSLKFGQGFSYKILKCVGKGGSASVYYAERADKSGIIKDHVALKIFNSETWDHNFRLEAKNLQYNLSSELVRYYSWDYVNEMPTLVMEYFESISLDKLFLYNLTEDEIRWIAFQIENALTSLSQVGLCHGDLSPANILINSKGQVKLIDYGLGNFFDRKGTYPYYSPQLEKGMLPNLSTDLYSLGMIISEFGASCNFSKKFLVQMAQWFEGKSSHKDFYLNKSLNKGQRLLSQRLNLNNNKLHTSKIDNVLPRFEKKRFTHLFKICCYAMILIISMFFNRDSLIKSTVLYSQLFIQTKNWFKIQLNGQDLGYTPIKLESLRPGVYHLKWKNDEILGERILTLKPGQSKLIGEFN